MIPILFDTNETSFTSNGLGRLRDCIECKVTEERNGVYEADFQYPVTGANFDRIKVGRIIGVTHNESEDIQPFDIVSYEKPINGIVTFHCTHISYRQSYMTVTGSNINSLADAFTLLGNAEPTNPFTYQTDKTSSAYMSGADGKPKSVRSLLGGTEGSILDTYGGEYEWDKFKVILHDSRGETRPFSIRYGVNMLEYNEDFDTQGSYSSCIPYWTDGTNTVVGDRQFATGVTIANRGECVPLDVTDKFEAQPTKAEVEAMGLSVMASKNVYNPTQTLHVEFARLQDVPDYENFRRLYECSLCDTVNVVFPDYKSTGQFKIVKTVWDVLKDRYDSMELGDLSISLSQALGIGSSSSYSGSSSPATENDFVVAQSSQAVTDIGTGTWRWREWHSGKVEIWYNGSVTLNTVGSQAGGVYRYARRITFPNNYSLYKCFCTVDGTSQGGWLNCGGLFNASEVHAEPYTKIEVMAYRISSRPDQNQDNTSIYICGEKASS